jgi:hypothetical protein
MSGNNLIVNNNSRKRRITTPLIALLIAVVISIAFASVFVYYPMAVTLQPVSPPVYFAAGTNSNQNDLGSSGGTSNTIYVSIGSNKTSLTITVHPTYQTAVYKSVARIVNGDSKAYNVWIYIRDTNISITASPLGSTFSTQSQSSDVKICFRSSSTSGKTTSDFPTPGYTNVITCVSLQSTGLTYIGSLLASSSWDIDLYVYIPEGAYGITSNTYTALIHLIYTTASSSETPP